MARNEIECDFRSSKMDAGSHFVKKRRKLIIDLKWREMRSKSDFRSSKMDAGSHFVKKRRKLSEKKSCLLIWNGEKCDQKWFLVIQNAHRLPFCEKKLHIDLKWREMWSKVIHPKWQPAAILWTKLKLRIDLKLWEMRSKVIFGHPKWPLAVILWGKKSCVFIWNGEKCDQKRFSVIQNGRQQPFCEKNKLVYWSEMVRNAIERDFRSSKMAACRHFVKKVVLLMLNGEKCDWKWFSVF